MTLVQWLKGVCIEVFGGFAFELLMMMLVHVELW